MGKVLQSKFRVSLTGGTPNIPGFWATFEGGALTRERVNAYDGGGGYDVLTGRATAEDITITRNYDPALDDGWLRQMRRNIMNGHEVKYNVSKQAVGANNASIGKPETYVGCPVLTVRTTPTADGSDATPAVIELVLGTKGPSD